MLTTMVPEQVKTMKIQAGIQVSSPGELKDNFNFGSALEDFIQLYLYLLGTLFTKLIDYYFQSKHKFHPRPGSPLHLPNEEPVLGYLKFSAKGTKREVFGMPILNDLITDDIRPSTRFPTRPGSPLHLPNEEPVLGYLKFSAKGTKQEVFGMPIPNDLITDDIRCVPVIMNPGLGMKWSGLTKGSGRKLKEFHSARSGSLPRWCSRNLVIWENFNASEVQAKGKEKVNESESDEEVSGIVASVQDEGQARPNPSEHDEGQARPNPGDAAVSQPPSSHVVHAGSDLEHMDLEASDTSIQPNPDQMDEEFTTTAYPNEHASLQNLDKELSFADQFLMEKSQEDEPEKTNTESEVQSMVTVPIHQDTSFVPLMTTSVIVLTVSQPVPTAVQAPLPALTATAIATTTTTTTTLPPIPPQPQQGSSDSILIKRIGELEQHMADMHVTKSSLDAVDWAIQAPLKDLFRDLPEADMKEILHHRMWESNSYQPHEDQKMLYEALEKLMARDHTDQLPTDLAEVQRKKKKRRDSPKTPPESLPHQTPPHPPPTGSSRTPGASRASGSSQLPPPPPPPSTNQHDQSTGIDAPSSSKTVASAEYTAWTTTDIRLKPSVLSIPEELHMDDDTTHDEQVQSSGDEDISHDHIPTMNLRQNWWKPLTEDRPATPEPAWSIPSSYLPVPVNN
ncbi:hypothetical protein Tco_1394947 [Tanacetum coccineum]